MDILQKWCSVSGAKFNNNKTVLIPIGKKSYRQEVNRSRKTNTLHNPIPPSVKIATDGTPTRILGAWIGNEISQTEVWSSIIEKIETKLNMWEKGNPTMLGRKMIIQSVIGGMTQYLTKVQGMPIEIEKHLIKTIRKFMWKNKEHPPVNLNTLYEHHEKGGWNVLDIASRNEAIQLTWLKTYTLPPNERPAWCRIADMIFTKNQKAGTRKDERTIRSPITSHLPVNTRSDRIPNDIKEMLNLSQKYNLTVDAPAISQEGRDKAIIWYHHASSTPGTRANDSKTARCLKEKHKIKSVKETKLIAYRHGLNHKRTKKCKCQECCTDRRAGCTNPAKCIEKARRLIEALPKKWHPDTREYEENLPEPENGTNDKPLPKPKIRTQAESIADCTRIFCDNHKVRKTPGKRSNAERKTETHTIAYTDGSCTGLNLEQRKAGYGIWYGDDDPRNKAMRVPGLNPTNQSAELLAVTHAIIAAPPGIPLKIISDSKYVIDGITKHLQRWEDKGWIGIKNAELFRTAATWLRKRNNITEFQWVKGHKGTHGNEEADKLASEGAQKNPRYETTIPIPAGLEIQGARLSAVKQADLYKGIRNYKKPPERKRTKENIHEAITSVSTNNEKAVSAKIIWTSIRNKDISREIREFMWKTLHNAHKIGDYWKNIPNFENRSICSLCKNTETMEHILLQCKDKCREILWESAKKTWQKKGMKWPEINMGLVMGCGATTFKNKDGEISQGANRLFRILVSETAWLIWKLRCTRVIEHDNDESKCIQPRSAVKKWLGIINTRLHFDKIMSNKKKFLDKAINVNLVLATWTGVIENESNLPSDWTRLGGVLVGNPIPNL